LSSSAALPFPLPGLRIYDATAGEPKHSPALAALASASDDALVERVARGDRDAFALLYRRYERPVFAVLLRLGGQRALAEEWLQEAFTRVWLAAGSHDSARGAVRSWIFAIALNTARSELARKRYRTRHVSLDETELDLPDTTGGEPPLAARLDGQRQAGALAAALLELPDHLREVVVLRCTRELSFAEIAEVTGCPQGTLKARFHRATQALKRRLARGDARGGGGAP
jgi:RNA polymerase sigma-70 factor (ECF subfamily)